MCAGRSSLTRGPCSEAVTSASRLPSPSPILRPVPLIGALWRPPLPCPRLPAQLPSWTLVILWPLLVCSLGPLGLLQLPCNPCCSSVLGAWSSEAYQSVLGGLICPLEARGLGSCPPWACVWPRCWPELASACSLADVVTVSTRACAHLELSWRLCVQSADVTRGLFLCDTPPLPWLVQASHQGSLVTQALLIPSLPSDLSVFSSAVALATRRARVLKWAWAGGTTCGPSLPEA